MGKKFQILLPDGMEEFLETIAGVIIFKALLTKLSSGIPGEESWQQSRSFPPEQNLIDKDS